MYIFLCIKQRTASLNFLALLISNKKNAENSKHNECSNELLELLKFGEQVFINKLAHVRHVSIFYLKPFADKNCQVPKILQKCILLLILLL